MTSRFLRLRAFFFAFFSFAFFACVFLHLLAFCVFLVVPPGPFIDVVSGDAEELHGDATVSQAMPQDLAQRSKLEEA